VLALKQAALVRRELNAGWRAARQAATIVHETPHGAAAVKRERKADWERIRTLALGLRLPGVEETTSMRQPTLKAHGKLWVWWSPHEDAPVFKVPFEEREILLEVEADTFFVTPHYRGHPMVLVRPERLDLKWAKANLIRVWRAQAPKRVLKAYDEQAQHAKPG
jgi:hypothetical protein